MAIIRVCDLCGKQITADDEEELYAVVIKKYLNVWRDWAYIDAHTACRKKLFDFAENGTDALTGGSSMQEE